MSNDDQKWLDVVAKEALLAVRSAEGGPFGACVVKNGILLAKAHNEVLKRTDATAHAEMLALRQASRRMGSYDLTGCTVYSSCEPCPMCKAAVYWSRASRLVFSQSRIDAAHIGFDDKHLYDHYERNKPIIWLDVEQKKNKKCKEAMDLWLNSPGRTIY